MRVSVQPVFVSAISNHARCEVRSHAGHWHKAEWPTVSARSVAITLSFVVTFFPFLSCSLVRGNRYMVHPLLPGYYQRFSCWRLTHDRRATNAAPSRIGTRSHTAIPMKAISPISTRSTSRSGMLSFIALPFVWLVCMRVSVQSNLSALGPPAPHCDPAPPRPIARVAELCPLRVPCRDVVHEVKPLRRVRSIVDHALDGEPQKVRGVAKVVVVAQFEVFI